jgi:hypothetical protein
MKVSPSVNLKKFQTKRSPHFNAKKLWTLQLAYKENTKKPWTTCVSSPNEVKTGKMMLITNPKPSLIQNSSLLRLPFSKRRNGHVMVDYLVHSKNPTKTFLSSLVLWHIKQLSGKGVFFLTWIHSHMKTSMEASLN